MDAPSAPLRRFPGAAAATPPTALSARVGASILDGSPSSIEVFSRPVVGVTAALSLLVVGEVRDVPMSQ
jgi:hypothetical protein